MHNPNRPTSSLSPRSAKLILAGSAAALLTLLLAPNQAKAQAISLGTGSGTYTQDFNTLPVSGTNPFVDNSTILGVYAQRTGNGTTIISDAGGGNAGGLYSYGPAASTDRALGSIGSSNAAAGSFAYGIEFQNSTAGALSLNTFGYTGEQWRNSAAAAQVITFWYQISASPISSLTPNVNTTWTAFSALDFSSPVTGGTAGAIDGNTNHSILSQPISLNLPVGNYIMFRWSDPDHTGTDHGLAIDDVNLAWSTNTYVPKNLVWNPSSSAWDTTTSNWLNGASASVFTNTDNVTFDDTGRALNSTVDIGAATVAPGNINVTNASGTYTFQNGAINASGTFTKTGAGSVTLAATYAGTMALSAGTLSIASAERIGDSSTVNIAPGATLNLGGFTETLGGVGLTGGQVTGSAGSLLQLNGDIAATAGTSTLSVPVSTNGAIRNVNLSNGANVVFGANIVGANRLQFTGAGSVTLSVDSTGTYSSNVQLNPGVTLNIGNKGALGTAQFFYNGGTFNSLSSFTGANAIVNTVSLGGSGTPTYTFSGSDTDWSGAWSYQFAGTRNLVFNNNTTLTGAFTATGVSELDVKGTGSFTMVNAGNVVQTVKVDGGTLVLIGNLTSSGGLTILNGGIVKGSGVLTGALTATDGFVIPQSLTDSTVTLSSGDLTVGASGTLKLDFAGNAATDYDSMNITGAVNLAGSLTTTLIGGYTPGGADTFILIANDGVDSVVGNFTGLPEGTAVPGFGGEVISYAGGDGNDVVITPTPEPGSVALLAGGVALLGARRRQRRHA